MKTQKINIIKDSINYLKIFVPLKKDFNDYLHIGQSISNPLQVSYIKKDKIKGLKENANVIISKRPTKTERKKYFTQTTINKLLKILFDCGTNNKYLEKCDSIAYDIDKHLKTNIKTEFFIEQNVAAFYSQTIQSLQAASKEITFKKWDKYTFSSNGSCMNEKNFNFFELYNLVNTDKQRVFIVGLKQGQHVIARALLWIKNERYFLDRIYINDNLQSSGFEEMQTKLFLAVKRTYKLNVLSCYNKTHITNYLKDKYKVIATLINDDKIKKPSLKCVGIPNARPSFEMLLDLNKATSINSSPLNIAELDYFPYMDSFKYIRDNTFLTKEEEESDIFLDSTCGSYTEVNDCCCDECSASIHEDDSIHSELDGETLCEDCSIYIDERGEHVNSNNAIYNEYSGCYHYREDLSY